MSKTVVSLTYKKKSTAKPSCKSSNRNIPRLNRTILPLSWMTGQIHYHTTLRYSTESMHTPYEGPALKPVVAKDVLESMPWNGAGSNGFWKSLGIILPNSSQNSCKTGDWGTRSNESASLQRVSTNTSRQVSRCSSNRCWEVLWRIIGRTFVSRIQTDLKQLGGNQQLCMGQRCGIEHANHSLSANFDENEAFLLIDATNAFNNLLNRKLALEDIKIICSALFNVVKKLIFIPIAALCERNNTMVRKKYHSTLPACNVHLRSCDPPPDTESLKSERNP